MQKTTLVSCTLILLIAVHASAATEIKKTLSGKNGSISVTSTKETSSMPASATLTRQTSVTTDNGGTYTATKTTEVQNGTNVTHSTEVYKGNDQAASDKSSETTLSPEGISHEKAVDRE